LSDKVKKELREAVEIHIFDEEMGEKDEKYTILHKVEEAEYDVFVFEWIDLKEGNKQSKVDFQRNVIHFFLKNELGIDSIVLHDDSGAPFLKNSKKFISISHSENLFAVQLSDVDRVGVDVQVKKDNIYRGRGYFINDLEEQNFEMTSEELQLIWSAKESVYKYKKGAVEHYREGISVLEIRSDSIFVELNHYEKITCLFLSEEKYKVVYVI